MASSTFKGKYKECFSCIFQFYDMERKGENCKYSHRIIQKNANCGGVKYERQFKYCGLNKLKEKNNV